MNGSYTAHRNVRDPQPSGCHLNVHTLVRLLRFTHAVRVDPRPICSSHGLVRRGHKLLVCGTWLLYLSSIVYWAATLGYIVCANNILSQAVSGLSSTVYLEGNIVSDSRVQTWDCIMTVALTVNVCFTGSCIRFLPADGRGWSYLDCYW